MRELSHTRAYLIRELSPANTWFSSDKIPDFVLALGRLFPGCGVSFAHLPAGNEATMKSYVTPNSFAAFSFMISGRTSSRIPIVWKSAIHLSGVIHG